MNVPPLLLHLAVASPDRRSVRLWLPVFLLWPLALVIGLFALAATAIADLALYLAGRRYHHYTVLLVRSCAALCEARGTVIRFNNEDTAVDMTVY